MGCPRCRCLDRGQRLRRRASAAHARSRGLRGCRRPGGHHRCVRRRTVLRLSYRPVRRPGAPLLVLPSIPVERAGAKVTELALTRGSRPDPGAPATTVVNDAVVLPCDSTRPSSKAADNAFAQVDGPAVYLRPLGTVLRQRPGEAPVHPTDPLVASLPVQRRLAPGEVADLVAAYRPGVPVEELAASSRANRTTALGHVRRHGVPKRDHRALHGEEVGRDAQLYAEGRSAEWVAAELHVAVSTVRRALKEAGVTVRPGGRQRRDDSTTSSPLNITEHKPDPPRLPVDAHPPRSPADAARKYKPLVP